MLIVSNVIYVIFLFGTEKKDTINYISSAFEFIANFFGRLINHLFRIKYIF